MFASRYEKLVNVSRLAELPIDVIGCGTIGRPLVQILAAMGARSLSIYDPDVVSEENLGNQGWRPGDIGMAKVDALSCEHAGKIQSYRTRVHRGTLLTGTVRFYCVDSVDSRREIASIPGAEMHIDGRIKGEACQIVCRTTGEELAKTVPESNTTLPCGTQSTLYIGYVCAGLMVSQFARWLRGDPTSDCYQNLAAGAGRWGKVL